MQHIGNPECCCEGGTPPCEDECCTPSSISFWMKYNELDIGGVCTTCDSGHFEVELTPTSCPEEGANSFLRFCDLVQDACPGEFDECGTGGEYFLCDTGTSLYPPGFEFACSNACYETSFSGPCWNCTGDGEFFPPASDITEYVIRAVSGRTTSNECITVVAIFMTHHYVPLGEDCEDSPPSGFSVRFYVFDHGDLGMEDCCDTYEWPTATPYCFYGCDGDTLRHGCLAAVGIAEPGHPEYGEVVFSC